jgi:hypothetical protein
MGEKEVRRRKSDSLLEKVLNLRCSLTASSTLSLEVGDVVLDSATREAAGEIARLLENLENLLLLELAVGYEEHRHDDGALLLDGDGVGWHGVAVDAWRGGVREGREKEEVRKGK